jgi:hypothetical protein
MTCEAEDLIRQAYTATEEYDWDPRLKAAREHLDAALTLIAAVDHDQAALGIDPADLGEDAHLEADYEDRFGGEC